MASPCSLRSRWRRADSRSAATISAQSSRAVTVGCQPSFSLALAGIAQQGFDLGGAEVARIDPHDDLAGLHAGRCIRGDGLDDGVFRDTLALEADPDAKLGCGPGDELPDRVLLPGGDDEVLGLVLLQHQPLHLDIVLGVAPVAQRVEVAEVEAVLAAPARCWRGRG